MENCVEIIKRVILSVILLLCLATNMDAAIQLPKDTVDTIQRRRTLPPLNPNIPEVRPDLDPLDPDDPGVPDTPNTPIENDSTLNGVPRLSALGPLLPATNTGNAVGTINGSLTVSNTGAAVYNMLFKTPNGGSLTPRVGLTYNSQLATYGLAGYGFTISGISCITVGERNMFNNNGSITGISYSMDDNLYLDGKRLILISGNRDEDGAQYCLEGDPYTKIVQHIYTSDGIRIISFEVFATDGKIYTYGTSLYSFQYRYTDAGNQKVIAWYISSVKDSRGNRVSYRYNPNNNYVYPDYINYARTLQSGEVFENIIKFEYEDLGVTKGSFIIAGEKGAITKRLSCVTTGTGESVYRKYRFNYDTESDKSGVKYARLTSVIEENGEGEQLNPINFNWSNLKESSPSISLLNAPKKDTTSLVAEQNIIRFMSADLNNDGISDIIKISNAETGVQSGSGSHAFLVTIKLSKKNSNGTVSYAEPNICLIPNLNSKSYHYIMGGTSVLDFNGDGYNDLVFMFNTPDESKNEQYIYTISGKDIPSYYSSFIDVRLQWKNAFKMVLTAKNSHTIYVTSDFNKDGKDEIFLLEQSSVTSNDHGNIYAAHLFAKDNNDQIIFRDTKVYLYDKPSKIFAGDYNNDGLMDIIILYKSGYKILYNRGGSEFDGYFHNLNAPTYTGYSIKDCWRCQQGDFNGDGQLDFVYCNSGEKFLRIAYNNGDGTFRCVKTADLGIADHETTLDNDKYSLVVLDMDKDGKSDVVVTKSEYEWEHLIDSMPGLSDFLGGTRAKHLYTKTLWLTSDGETLKLKRSATTNREHDALESLIFTGDFDGDGIFELANFGGDLAKGVNSFNEDWIYVYKSTGFKPSDGKITSVTDGMGNYSSVEYEYLTNPSVYSRTDLLSYTSFPSVLAYTLPINVVKSHYVSNGAAGGQTTNYKYKDFKVHMKGGGPIGFQEINTHNIQTGEETTVTVTQFDENRCIPLETKSVRTLDGQSSTIVTKTKVEEVGGTYFAYGSRVEVTDMDGNTADTENEYDIEKGVLTKQTVWNDGTDMYKQSEYSEFVSKSGVWLPSTLKLTQKHKDDSNPYSTVTKFEYSDKGDILKTITNYGTELALTTTATYDSYGNRLSSVVSGKDVVPITKYNEYDETGRFVVHSYQSPEGADNRFTYDKWGNLLTETDETDPSNIMTQTRVYDNWGRLKSVTAPDGTQTVIKTGWGSSVEQKYYVLTQITGKPWTLTWYDATGKETETISYGPTNLLISKKTKYNSLGLVSSVESQTGLLKSTATNSYNAQGRISSTVLSSGSVIDYSYGNRTVSKTTDGKTVTQTTDAWGNKISSLDPTGGEVKYTYSSNGKPVSVESNGTAITFTYDASGNKISMVDPDAGTMTYTYAADRTLLTQTDAKGVTTAYSRDALGRIDRATIGDYEVENTYGTSGHSNMRLLKNSMGGNSIEYTYDQFGRITSESRTLANGANCTFSFEYGADNRLSKTVFPGGLNVTYEYDESGFLKETKADGKSIYKLEDFTGLESKSIFEENIRYIRKLNNEGFEKQRELRLAGGTEPAPPSIPEIDAVIENEPSNSNDGNLLDGIKFEYNRLNGNLVSRTREGAAKETYGYDDLDRLTSVEKNSSVHMNIEYSLNGNISAKTGLGSYTYNSSFKPHAVTGVENTGMVIPSETLVTSFNDLGRIQHISREETGLEMDFGYGPDMQRWYSSLTQNGDTVRSVLYARNYEKVTENGITREYYYLDGNTVIVKQNGEFTPYHAFSDNIGSILALYDKDGNKVFDAEYDAWGKQTVHLNDIGLIRGYTGHEMLNEFGIINMNGRLYDPVLGRFFSPDPYVQLPDFTQNFNRYSYCLNNPLKYTDPTGELFGIDDAVIAFALYNMASSMMRASIDGQNIWKAGGVSLLGSALSFGIGEYFGSVGSVGHELLRAGAHGVSGGLVSALNGGNFAVGFGSSALSSGLGSYAQMSQFSEMTTLTCASIGGLATWAMGGDFIQGAIMGLKIGLLNHGMHDYLKKRVDPDGLVSWDMPELEVKARKLDRGDSVALLVTSIGDYNSIFDDSSHVVKKYLGEYDYPSSSDWGTNKNGLGQIWKNNQSYISSVARSAAKYTGIFAIVQDGVTFANVAIRDIKNYETTNWYNTMHVTGEFIGGYAGSKCGMYMGLYIGGVVGGWFGGVGAIPGAVIGGVIGLVAGNELGMAIGGRTVNYYYE